MKYLIPAIAVTALIIAHTDRVCEEKKPSCRPPAIQFEDKAIHKIGHGIWHGIKHLKPRKP